VNTEAVLIAMAGLVEAHGKLAAGEFQVALDAATTALARLTITDSTVATAAASLEAIAFDAAYNLGDFALAFTHAAREVEHAERAELPETMAKALNNRAVARMEVGELAAAAADLQEALRVLEQRTTNWRTSARSSSRTSNKLRCCAGTSGGVAAPDRGSSQTKRCIPTSKPPRLPAAATTPAQFASLSAHWPLPGE
jgi:tetratricopeptide (TPR) repeat protein